MTSIIYYPGYAQVVVTPNLRVREVSAISNSNPMIVTTDEDHGYVVGMMVRFQIPSSYGMVELNGLTGQVLEITDDTLTISIDSLNFTPFAAPSPLPSAYTPPVVIPDSSGVSLSHIPLPYGNQNTFEGVIYNQGMP